MNFEVYTDGACSGNPGKGGWAYVMVSSDGIEVSGSGYEEHTTNNRMELIAIIESLIALDQNLGIGTNQIIVYSDSAYIMNCYAAKWWENWLENDWKTANKKPVKNQDLWERLIPFFKRPNIHFCKVKGHADNEYNNIVDKMAVQARSF